MKCGNIYLSYSGVILKAKLETITFVTHFEDDVYLSLFNNDRFFGYNILLCIYIIAYFDRFS